MHGRNKKCTKNLVRIPEGKILFKYKERDRKIIWRWILIPSLFCVVMQRMLVAVYRRFGKAYRFPLQGSSIVSVRYSTFKQVRQDCLLDSSSAWAAWILKKKPTGCPETSVKHYQYMLSKNSEVLRSNADREESLKSHNMGLKESMWTEFVGLMKGTKD